MKNCLILLILFTTACYANDVGQVVIPVDEQDLVTYQAAPLAQPVGGDDFKGSNFIHPLKTPSGFTVTDSQPGDHPHHFGLWWPWKFIEYEGRKILCWELQKGDGLVQAVDNKATADGLITNSIYLDRKAPDGPATRLNEETEITVSNILEQPVSGYFLDLKIAHKVAGEQPIIINKYRYSGLGFRGSKLWNKDNSTILTSEGNERDSANFNAARWVRVEGATDKSGTAGVLLMAHPANHNHPEKIRTWNQQHKGAIFINFNPVMDQPMTLEPGTTHVRLYRLFIYDGTLSAESTEELWQAYAKEK